MIIYSCAPNREIVVRPGERIIYGATEHEPMGLGTVCMTPQGELQVNRRPLRQIVHKYAYVRKFS